MRTTASLPALPYTLAILTHGRSDPLGRTLASFQEHVTPAPAAIRVHGDGVMDLARIVGLVRGYFPNVTPAVSATHPDRQGGFCTATARLWDLCAHDADADEFVFWLEHDFAFERRVDLGQLAALLESDPELAQVALVRQAVNHQEIAAGGLVESRPGEFTARKFTTAGLTCDWLEHRSFFTTNPSLMRVGFMRDRPFRDDGREACEGRYGLDLVEDGYRFGFWGDGFPWVRHVGIRDGFGY